MPLPPPGTAWPPAELANVTPKIEEWSAWWAGDARRLTDFYLNRSGPRTRPSQHAGGVVGAAARFWWGRPQVDLTQQRDQIHVPLAADLARTSADLLFSEAPSLRFEDETTQAWLEEDAEDGLLDVLTGAAERCAAEGGVYLRVTWDRTVRDRVFITTHDAASAIPEFSWGILRAVTFWTVVHSEGQTRYRHLERHELDGSRNGLVQHGLFRGTEDSLGARVDLRDRPETAALAVQTNAEGYLTEGISPGLLVVYVPNTGRMTARAWSRIPEGRYLGGSDLDGVEALLDNLDEVHASWMRDLRLAKARLIVARYMLDDHGPGGGATMNLDQEVFSPLKLAPGEDKDAPITPVQFAIRFEEHKQTAEEWANRIIRTAGYSLQTFGEYAATQLTATEVQSRDDRSSRTRERKLRAWRPALREILTKLVATQVVVFGDPLVPERPSVVFPDGVRESPLQIAQTSSVLRTAEAASTRTLVALNHPDWTDTQVDQEVALIAGERGAAAPDPFAIGRTPAEG